VEQDAFEVIRGGEARAKMIALNREDPAALDKRFVDLKPALAEAVRAIRRFRLGIISPREGTCWR
jgi:hypothetical protein